MIIIFHVDCYCMCSGAQNELAQFLKKETFLCGFAIVLMMVMFFFWIINKNVHYSDCGFQPSTCHPLTFLFSLNFISVCYQFHCRFVLFFPQFCFLTEFFFYIIQITFTPIFEKRQSIKL